MKNGSKPNIQDIYELINEFRQEVRDSYVTKVEFFPIKTIVYGMVGLILVGVFTAIIAGVIRAAVL